ncbi:MAG: TetR/AcrR family transcriptional regulator [Verrucomicrobiaceae bacterium]|nr:MAG: TetR/AcrR family transcriptional regulator [Verrucomicrobiaceae bacterium]
MKIPSRTTQKRGESLSRERIIEASIELLDGRGEGGLTFRTLSERLATGAGAIYWHIANKNDLLAAACDAIISRTVDACVTDAAPEEAIRALALGIFEAFEKHPWVGSVLAAAPGLPVVRIVERLGRQLDALGVPHADQWATVSALLNYILGVAGQNAANTLLARKSGADRTAFLDAVATRWSALDADDYPFTRGVAEQMRTHDDLADFLAGIDIILRGIRS